MKRSLVVGLLFGLLSCANRNGGGDDAGSTFTSGEKNAFDSAVPSAIGLLEVAAVANGFFQFDPTLDSAQSDVANAQLIHDHVAQNLGTGDDGGVLCGTLSLSSNTLTATFPSSGCKLGGITVTGTIALTVTKTTSLTVAFTFTNVTLSGTALSGSVSFAASDAASFTVDANLTWGATTFTATSFTVAGTATSVSFDGSLSSSGTSLSFQTVVWNDGDCYPSAGSVTIQSGIIAETITFSAASATTGQVTVTIGKKSVPATLPAYGSCG